MGLSVRAGRGEPSPGRATSGLADPTGILTPASHPEPRKTYCWECQSADILPPVLSERRSAFSTPVDSTHQKQQRTAGPQYRLSPADKRASSVVHRFSDTLPWAIVLLLLPSPLHTLSIRLLSSLLNIVTITHSSQ